MTQKPKPKPVPVATTLAPKPAPIPAMPPLDQVLMAVARLINEVAVTLPSDTHVFFSGGANQFQASYTTKSREV